jgi:hypothetical protein
VSDAQLEKCYKNASGPPLCPRCGERRLHKNDAGRLECSLCKFEQDAPAADDPASSAPAAPDDSSDDQARAVADAPSGPAIGAEPAIECASEAWTKIESAFRAEFHEPDMGAVRAVYAAVAAHFLPGPTVWVFDIAPPSSGKTEKLMPLAPAVGAHIISSVTPQTFLSGKVAGDGSLLTKIGKAGIIVCKDFSQVLSMPRKTKGPILADFRDIYDGYVRKEFGASWVGF